MYQRFRELFDRQTKTGNARLLQREFLLLRNLFILTLANSSRGELCLKEKLRISKPEATMDVDSQPTMEETVLVGDDLMMGPPSPLIPPEIASHVLEGVDLCDGILRNLFLCLQINDIEPFCQEEIVLYRECAEKRDKELRRRLEDSEYKLGLSMPLDKAKDRASQLESETTLLERRLILANGIEGAEGFRQRWSLHGRLTDTKKRMEALKQGLDDRKPDEPVKTPAPKRWFLW